MSPLLNIEEEKKDDVRSMNKDDEKKIDERARR